MKTSLIKGLRIVCTVIVCLLFLIVVQLKGVKQDRTPDLVESDEVRHEAYYQNRAEVKLSAKAYPRGRFNSQTTPQYETAILERFEGKDKAVFLLEELQQEVIIPKQMLPNQAGIHTWFDVWIDPDQDIIVLSVNENKTKQEQERAKEIQNQLRHKK